MKYTPIIILLSINFSFSQQLYKDEYYKNLVKGRDSVIVYLDSIIEKGEPSAAFSYALAAKAFNTYTNSDSIATNKLFNEAFTNLDNIRSLKNKRSVQTDMLNFKALYYTFTQRYKQSLPLYQQALEIAEFDNNYPLIAKLKCNMVSLYTEGLELDRAIKLAKESLKIQYVHKNRFIDTDFKNIYLTNYMNLAYSYKKIILKDSLKKHYFLDSLKYYSDKISDKLIVYNLQDSRKNMINQTHQADYHSLKKNYALALVHYTNAYNIAKKRKDTLKQYLYKYNLGEIQYWLGNKEKSFDYFNAVIYSSQDRNLYVKTLSNLYLSKIYERKKKYNLALKHLQNYYDLNKKFSEETNTLIQRTLIEVDIKNKDRHIKQLKEKANTQNNYFITIVILLFTLIVTISFIYIRKLKKDKKTISNLMVLIQKPNPLELVNSRASYIISDKKLKEIYDKLHNLEEKELYLKQEYNMIYAAKKLRTNTTYLSKVINQLKKQSFNEYTNYLRINYVLKRLHKDIQFRKYTIKAIAEEVGYSTAESLTHNFKRKTGISPAKFIKELNKKMAS